MYIEMGGIGSIVRLLEGGQEGHKDGNATCLTVVKCTSPLNKLR